MNIRPQRRKDAKKVNEASSLVALMACVFFLLTSSASAVELNLTVMMPEDPVLVGDQVELTVTTVHPTNWTVKLPEIGREKDVVVLKRDWNSEALPNGEVRDETVYKLTSFRLGEHIISTNRVIYSTGEESFTNAFPEVALTVVSSLPDDASSKIGDIKPVHKLPGRIPPALWIALGAAAIAFGIGLLTARFIRNRPTDKPAPPPEPPHVVALRSLEQLQAKGLLEENAVEPFYVELSLILRTYLEGRFNLNAPDETTEEIVEEMSRSPELSGTQRNILQDFMRQADMVKFAKGHPDRHTMEEAFDTTKQFVEETKSVGEAVPQIGNRKSEIGNPE